MQRVDYLRERERERGRERERERERERDCTLNRKRGLSHSLLRVPNAASKPTKSFRNNDRNKRTPFSLWQHKSQLHQSHPCQELMPHRPHPHLTVMATSVQHNICLKKLIICGREKRERRREKKNSCTKKVSFKCKLIQRHIFPLCLENHSNMRKPV